MVFLAGTLILIAATMCGCSKRGPAPEIALKELQASFAHHRAGRYQEAVAAAKAALEADPSCSDAYTNLAVSYMALGRLDEAEEAAREAVRRLPDSQLAKNNLAWILDERRTSKAPRGPTAPSAQSDEVVALLNQSFEHAEARRFEDCIATATRVTQLAPANARAYNNAAVCRANLGQWDEAIRDAEEAIRIDPGFQLAKNNLAWMQSEKLRAGTADTRESKRD